MPVDKVTVTDKFLRYDGTPQTGSVTFTGPDFVTDQAGGALRIGTTHAKLNSLGIFTVDLVATDSQDLNPVNWTYQVVIHVDERTRHFSVLLPKATPNVSLRDLAAVPLSGGSIIEPFTGNIDGGTPDEAFLPGFTLSGGTP